MRARALRCVSGDTVLRDALLDDLGHVLDLVAAIRFEHDCEKAHSALVRKLKLVDERYKANTADPVYLEQMGLVNHLCSWIRRYVERFACMKSGNLQAYLDWFVYLHRVHRDEEKWPVEERVVRHLALSDGIYLREWQESITQLVDPCISGYRSGVPTILTQVRVRSLKVEFTLHRCDG